MFNKYTIHNDMLLKLSKLHLMLLNVALLLFIFKCFNAYLVECIKI